MLVTKYTNECLIGNWNGHSIRTVYCEGHAYMVLEDIFKALDFKEADYVRSMFATEYQVILEVRDYGKLLCVDTRGIVWATTKSRKLEVRKFQMWALNAIESMHAISRRKLFASEVLPIKKEKEN